MKKMMEENETGKKPKIEKRNKQQQQRYMPYLWQ